MAAKPKPPGTGPGIHPRKSDERRFERALRTSILNPMVRNAEDRIREAGQSYAAIRQAIRDIPSSPLVLAQKTERAATAAMRRLNRWHTRRFRRLMTRALGVDIGPLDDLAIEPEMRRVIHDSVRVVKTIPPRYHAALERDIAKLGEDAPFDQQKLRNVLRKNYRSAGYNLRRLTRDQTNKAVGGFNGIRQQQAGVESYIWSTSKDSRVRPTHRHNDGLIFRWDSPPSQTGPPGWDVQCRCVALPLIDGVGALAAARQRPAGLAGGGPTLPLPAVDPARVVFGNPVGIGANRTLTLMGDAGHVLGSFRFDVSSRTWIPEDSLVDLFGEGIKGHGSMNVIRRVVRGGGPPPAPAPAVGAVDPARVKFGKAIGSYSKRTVTVTTEGGETLGLFRFHRPTTTWIPGRLAGRPLRRGGDPRTFVTERHQARVPRRHGDDGHAVSVEASGGRAAEAQAEAQAQACAEGDEVQGHVESAGGRLCIKS